MYLHHVNLNHYLDNFTFFSKYHKRGRCAKCDYEKNQSNKYKDKKTSNFCDQCSKARDNKALIKP